MNTLRSQWTCVLLSLAAVMGARQSAQAEETAPSLSDRCVAARLNGDFEQVDELLRQVKKPDERFDLLAADRAATRLLQQGKMKEALKATTKNFDAASSLKRGDPVRLCCAWTHLVANQVNGKAADVNPLVLDVSAEFLEAGRSAGLETEVVQSWIQALFWNPIDKESQKAFNSLTSPEAFSDLERNTSQSLSQVERKLLDSGVPRSVASFGWLVLAKLQFDAQRFDHCVETLKKIRPYASDPLPRPVLRSAYWTLQGLLETHLDNFEAARTAHETALQLCRRHNLGASTLAQRLNNFGFFLLKQGDADAAFEQLDEACRIYEELADNQVNPADYSQALTNLAKTYEARRQFFEAGMKHRGALRQAERSPSPIDDLICRNNLGIYQLQNGDSKKASETLKNVHEKLVSSFGAEHLRVAECTLNLGWAAYTGGDEDLALRHFNDATALLEKIVPDYHPRLAEARSYLARVLVDADRFEEAAGQLEKALLSQRQFLENIMATALSERDRLALVQSLRLHLEASCWPGLLETFFELSDSLKAPPEKQYEVLLYWKGVVDRHSFHLDPQTLDEQGKRLLEERLSTLEQLRAAYMTRVGPQFARQHQQQVEQLQQRANRLQRELLATTAALSPQTASIDSQVVKGVLQDNEALVDLMQYWPLHRDETGYLTREPEYVAYVLRPGKDVQKVALGDSEVIDDTVTKLFTTTSSGDGVAYKPHAMRLSKLFREPLAQHLDGVDLVIFCGDGRLHRVPVAMLPVDENKVWLDQTAFGWTTTADALVKRRKQVGGSEANGELIVAGVDYGDPKANKQSNGQRGAPRKIWDPLNATIAEGRAVEKIFSNFAPDQPVVMLTGKQATEDRVVQALKNHRFVHLATHGDFDFGQFKNDVFTTYDLSAAFDSSLILANVNETNPTAPVDQVLTAQEISTLDLRHVELMVMAACSTGMGHVRAGQGVVGLLGALEQAGVRTNVSALWPIGDEPTFHVMRRFHDYYFNPEHRLPVAKAMRRAQLDLLYVRVRSADGKLMNHPSLWAPFIVSGDPASVYQDR